LPGDEERIHVPLDFVGINYYYRTVVRAGESDPVGPSGVWVGKEDITRVLRGLPQTKMGWVIEYDQLRMVVRLLQALRAHARRLRDARTHAEGQRPLVRRGHKRERPSKLNSAAYPQMKGG
jgi:hypothetical protein